MVAIAIARMIHHLCFCVFFFLIIIIFPFHLRAQSSSSPNNPPLRLLVPVKEGFQQFVTFDNNTHSANGFAVDVFLSALRIELPLHPLNYTFIPFRNSTHSTHTPSYDAMVQELVNGGADAVVADLTITRERMDSVDFSMPYIGSGLAMVTKFRYGAKGAFWDFLRPFSVELWLALLLSFLVTSLVLLFHEKRNPDFFPHPQSLRPSITALSTEASPGPMNNEASYNRSYYRQVMNALWFISL